MGLVVGKLVDGTDVGGVVVGIEVGNISSVGAFVGIKVGIAVVSRSPTTAFFANNVVSTSDNFLKSIIRRELSF